MKIKEENDLYIIVEMISLSGNSYEIGYPKASGYRSDTLISQLQSIAEKHKGAVAPEANNWVALYWPPNGDSQTYRVAIQIGITGGYVNQASDYIWYKYQLNFANYTGNQFSFKDQSGDIYTCVTALNGNHYVNYNSPNATILAVQ